MQGFANGLHCLVAFLCGDGRKRVLFSHRVISLHFQLDAGALLSRVVLFSLLHQTQKEGHMASSYFLPREMAPFDCSFILRPLKVRKIS